MSLLLHAITTPPTREADDGFIRLEVGELVAWTTDRGAEAAPFTPEDALRHHTRVVDVFARVEGCLPARFPTVFVDETSLRLELEPRYGELARRLEAVRGACELGVTVVWTAPEAAPRAVEATSPGRRYLLQRRAALAGSERRHALATALAEALLREAGKEVRDSTTSVCPSREVALSLALLVGREIAEEVRQRLVRQTQRDVRILVHGPWPPYTFAQ